MTQPLNKFSILLLVVAETLLVSYLDYTQAGTYYSLDVLYCLPVIQAARLGAIHAMRRTDSQMPTFIAIVVALMWSMVEVIIVWPTYPLSAFVLNVFTRSVTFTVIGRVVAKLWKEREYALKDPLTNLANRFDFFERFEIEQLRSERTGNPFSLLFIDIDRFKKLNDDRGHQVGDEALKMLANILRGNSRRIDIVARFGGDEFVLVFPETDEQSCAVLVDRIKLTAEKEFLKQGWSIALSIGQITETGKKRGVNEILREADAKMYSAKREKQEPGDIFTGNQSLH